MFGRMMVSALALTGVAYAQQAPTPPSSTNEAVVTPSSTSADRVTYEAAQFAQYNPQTALDMVRQIPGFTLDGGDDRRGFSGAVGNLLIDGVRPSTKSQGVEGILSRIPANQVVRLEVLRGAAVAGDASGQSTLLNVVRTPTAGSGVYSAGFELTSRDVAAPRGELSYSGRAGNIEWGVGGSIFSQYRDLPGWRLLYNPADTYVGRVETPSPRDFRETTLNGNIAFPLFGGRLSATSQWNWWRFHADSDYIFYDAADVFDFSSETVFEEQRRGYEVGLNYERDIGPWSLALIGLVNRGLYTSEEDGIYTNLPINEYFQDVRQETGETIFRATLARPLGPRMRVEFGGEAALNTLDQALIYAEDGTVIGFTNDNVTIEEERAELFASHTWRPTDRWSLETRLNWETSTLTFTGDTDDVVELSYWKPSVQLSRTFGGNNQLRVRVYRDVGQLDFGDFTTAAAVADNLIAGGNPELVPHTAWIAEFGGDLHFPGGSALSFTLAQHEISDVSDLVLIEDDRGTPLDTSDDLRYDAPGNIGDGEMTRLDVNFSTPAPFIEGGRLTLVGMLADHEVTDPVTGQPRIISYTPESRYEINFRQDLPQMKFAWGISVFKEGEFQAYRFNEIDTSEEGPWIDLFVETTALPYGMKLRAWAANLFDGTVYRDRRFFNETEPAPPFLPIGRTGDNTSRDYRQREFARAPWFILELSGTF